MRTIVGRVVVAGLLCGLVAVGMGRGAVAAGAAPADASARVNVNAASVDELASLPGIGPSLARAIVEARTGSPFQKPEDLRKVKGIGDKLYERLKDRITVGDPGAAKGRGS
jgi:competence protein ComEA